jgi:Dolichyl-phosphate-mannose-protein mannosyltransferase
MSSRVSDAYEGARGKLVASLLAIVFVRLWLMPLGSSLWLDEIGTYWVTNARFTEIVPRAKLFPQSVPYAAIVWMVRALGGNSEIVLRLPSVLAAGLAVWVLYRLGLEFFDRETAFLAIGIFVALPSIAFAAADARPYAFAVLTTIGALWMLVRWLERGRTIDAGCYVLFATATIYFHYLFATTLVAHAAYALSRWRRGARVPLTAVVVAAAAMALLVAPGAILVVDMARDRAFHSYGRMPGMDSMLEALAPPIVLGALLLSVFVGWSLRPMMRLQPFPPARKSSGSPDGASGRVAPEDALWLLSLSVGLPVALLAVASRATGVPVFHARYMMCVDPAVALLAAWLLRTIQPDGVRRAVAACYLLIMFMTLGNVTHLGITHTKEDWRAAMQMVRALTGQRPVLMSGIYIESDNLAWVQDARHLSYMRAPLDVYPTGGSAVILPLRRGPGREAYVERLLASTPGLEDRFVLIDRSGQYSWAGWLDERLGPKGYVVRQIADFPPLRVWMFESSRTAGRPARYSPP